MNQSVVADSAADARPSDLAGNNLTMHSALQANPDGTKAFQAAICLIVQTERDIARKYPIHELTHFVV